MFPNLSSELRLSNLSAPLMLFQVVVGARAARQNGLGVPARAQEPGQVGCLDPPLGENIVALCYRPSENILSSPWPRGTRTVVLSCNFAKMIKLLLTTSSSYFRSLRQKVQVGINMMFAAQSASA